MAAYASTHQLLITLKGQSPFALIPHIRMFVDGVAHDIEGQTLRWIARDMNNLSVRFVGYSPYNDGLTQFHVKRMLDQCLSWLSPMVNGFPIEIGYSICVYRSQGTMTNIGGVTSDHCLCSRSHPPAQPPLKSPMEIQAETLAIKRTQQKCPQTKTVGNYNNQQQTTADTPFAPPPTPFVDPSLFK